MRLDVGVAGVVAGMQVVEPFDGIVGSGSAGSRDFVYNSVERAVVVVLEVAAVLDSGLIQTGHEGKL